MTVLDHNNKSKLLRLQLMAAAEALASHTGRPTDIILSGEGCDVVIKVKKVKREKFNQINEA